MGAVKKLNIELSEELVSQIDAAVDSGDYKDASDVVDEALRAWQRERGVAIAELRELVQEGIDSGGWAPWNVEAILNEERARFIAPPADD